MKTTFWKTGLRLAAWLVGVLAVGLAAHGQSSTRSIVPHVGLMITNLASGLSQEYELPAPRETKDASGKSRWELEDYVLETSDFQLNLRKVTLDPDPSINYSISVIDFGAPTSFIFTFTTPIVPTGFPNQVAASIEGSLLDARGDGVSLTPINSLLQEGHLLAPDTNAGVDVGAGSVFGVSGAPNTSYAYGPYNVGPLAGPGPGPWTGLQAIAAFSLTGDHDEASLIGSFSIVPSNVVVPESGSWVAVGAMAFGLFGRALWRHARR